MVQDNATKEYFLIRSLNDYRSFDGDEIESIYKCTHINKETTNPIVIIGVALIIISISKGEPCNYACALSFTVPIVKTKSNRVINQVDDMKVRIIKKYVKMHKLVH